MCLHYKTTNDTQILVGVYVEDLLATSDNVRLVDKFFEDMTTYDVKDLGVAANFQGIKIECETVFGYS
jgi:hypothetical protein